MRQPLFLTALLCTACFGGDDVSAPSGGPPPALVRVASVGPGELTESWVALAEVRALGQAELAAGAAGPVSSVKLREGGRVSKGDTIVVIDDDLARARFEAAEAAVAEATIEQTRRHRALERRQGVASDVLSAEELSDAASNAAAQDARVRSLQAAAAEARAQLRRHRITAPFDGVLSRRLVDEGDWVTVGQPVGELVSIEAVEARVRVPLALSRQLQPGTEVGLGTGRGFVEAVVPALDPATRTALVRISPADGLRLSPGEATEVSLPVSWEGAGVTLPRDALLQDPKETRVFEVVVGEDGVAVAEARVVEVLATDATTALVVNPELAPGDRVVTRGNERVRPGQALKIEGAP